MEALPEDAFVVIDAFRKLVENHLKLVSELGNFLEVNYKLNKNNILFRNTMISTFMQICEKAPGIEKEDFEKIINSLKVSEEVKEMLLEDLEDAIENLHLKKFMEANKNELTEAIEKFDEKVNVFLVL